MTVGSAARRLMSVRGAGRRLIVAGPRPVGAYVRVLPAPRFVTVAPSPRYVTVVAALPPDVLDALRQRDGLPVAGPQLVKVTPRPNTATRADLEWERRAAHQEVDALTIARAAAEKWTTAITSLTGVFGIVALV